MCSSDLLLGLELSLKRLWQLRRYVLGVGMGQVALTALLIGGALRLAGADYRAAIILGLCLALSSTAVAMQVLTEQNRAFTPTGRVSLSVLLFQDMMVVPILFVVGMLATERAPDDGALEMLWMVGQALGAVLLLVLAGRYLLGPLMRSAVRTGRRDLIIALTLLIVVSFSSATALAGLSPALGAFLAGLMLGESEARHHIEVDIEPFKDLLLGIFFITVGTSIDLIGIAPDAALIVGALLLMMGSKAAVLYAVARGFSVSRAVSAEVALLLSQAGEFAFVVIGIAASRLPPRLVAGAITMIGLSMLFTPVAGWIGRRLAAWLEPVEHRGSAPGAEHAELEDHIVIGGCGRVGHLVAEALKVENIPFICLDTDGDGITRMRQQGWPVYYGDASRPELLERVGGKRARAFVVTLNDTLAAEHMVRAARSVNRGALIFARAKDHLHAARLVKLGALGVIPEAVEAGLQLTGRVLEALDLPLEQAEQRVAEMRAAELARLDDAEAAGSGPAH